MIEKLTLFYRPGACALAPHIALNWIGWEHEAVNVPRDERYRKINPSGAVPAIQFPDGSVLTQCSAILTYLAEEKGRTDLLGGEDLRQRAEVSKWGAFFTGDLHPAFFPVFAPRVYTTQDDDAARESVKQAGLKIVRKHLSTIEDGLTDRSCFVGETYSIADAYAVPMLRWVAAIQADGLNPWPNTKAFYEQICTDRGVVDAMKTQGISA